MNWVYSLLSSTILFVTTCGCNSPTAAEEFSDRFGVVLPVGATLLQKDVKGVRGGVFTFSVRKADLLTIKATASGYSAWCPVKQGMAFEAAGRKFHGLRDVRGEYAMGKPTDGLCPVLIVDMEREILYGLMLTGFM